MTVNDNENFNNFSLEIDQNEEIQRTPNQPSSLNNSFTIVNNPETVDECALIFNIIFLISGCLIYPIWLCSCCYLTNPNPSVRLIAKINVCLFMIPCILTLAACILLAYVVISILLSSMIGSTAILAKLPDTGFYAANLVDYY